MGDPNKALLLYSWLKPLHRHTAYQRKVLATVLDDYKFQRATLVVKFTLLRRAIISINGQRLQRHALSIAYHVMLTEMINKYETKITYVRFRLRKAELYPVPSLPRRRRAGLSALTELLVKTIKAFEMSSFLITPCL